MITKEGFLHIIETIRQNWERNKKFSELGLELWDFTDPLVSSFEELIKIEMGKDAEGLVGWWLYDAPEGIEGNPTGTPLRNNKMEPIDVSTPEALYDYIMETFNANQQTS